MCRSIWRGRPRWWTPDPRTFWECANPHNYRPIATKFRPAWMSDRISRSGIPGCVVTEDRFVKSRLIIGAVLLAFAATGARAEAVFTASNGAELSAPDISRLSCAERGTLLLEYSISGYRGTEPLAPEHPDRKIYEYENQLAQVFYMQCQAGTSHYQDSAPAFTQGFD